MNLQTFYTNIRPMFGGSLSQAQVDGFGIIFEAWRKVGSGNDRDLAYILATAYHETARTMQPVRETLATTDAKAKERLTKAWKSGKLPWVKSDYWSGGWFGRGFVQLTHRANYVKAGEKLGIDLVADPSKAMIPEVSALILVRGMLEGWFTGLKLADAAVAEGLNAYVNYAGAYHHCDRAQAKQHRLASSCGVGHCWCSCRCLQLDCVLDRIRGCHDRCRRTHCPALHFRRACYQRAVARG